MTLAIACPVCGARPGDSCWGADGRSTQQHAARLEEGEAPFVFREPLTNYVADAAEAEARRGDERMWLTLHPQHPPRPDATIDDLRDYDDVMGRPQ